MYLDLSQFFRKARPLSVSISSVRMCIFSDIVNAIVWIETFSLVQSTYSSALNKNSQTYSRNCRSVNYYYETIVINVNITNFYNFISESDFDTVGYIYENSFNPLNPYENLLAENDDARIRGQFEFSYKLQVSTTYILVVTTFEPNTVGDFSIFVKGPNRVHLSRTSKSRFDLSYESSRLS